MARDKKFAPNIDNSSPLVYPSGRIQDNTGSGNGTPVNNFVYSDLHEMKDKLMRLYGITYNGLPDNETNGFQLVDALRALASKNDFILDLTDTAGVLQVPVKLSFMLEKESILCLSGVDLSAQTQIKGSDSVTYSITTIGGFKNGEYVRLIKTASGVTLIREVDAVNLDLAVSELLYLKKASQAQENAGLVDIVGTTPLSNLTAFIRRVNGVDSSTYLATAVINGLYPKEHFAIVAGLGAPALRNVGSFSGVEVSGGSVGALPVTGDLTSATITNTGGGYTTIRCVVTNAMDNTNYEVQTSVQSQAAISADNTVGVPVFKIIDASTFDVSIREFATGTQNLKINIRAYQL